MRNFDLASPLDYRYYAAEPAFSKRLQPYVSESGYIGYQTRVELALVLAMRDVGLCSEAAAQEVAGACAKVTTEEVYREEKRIGHVVRALTNIIRKNMAPENRRFVHLFATSNDVTDSANALRYQELTREIILPDLIELQRVLIKLARRHAETPQIGRTHGMHAEPITFGFALALYVDRLGTRIKTIEGARQNLRGKLSGAVGAYNALSLQFPKAPHLFERLVLAYLGLQPADRNISSQIVEPEYLTDLAFSVVSCFSVLANLADDMRHLHRSEIAEVAEGSGKSSVGSSTMPHKNNPKNFELVKSLWKAYMPRMTTIHMDQISEHQRDLTNSASSRFLPELMTAFDYCTQRLIKALSNLEVKEEKMRQNLEMSGDAISAEPLYILLSLAEHPDAYDYAKKLVGQAQGSGKKLTELLEQDKSLRPYLAKFTAEQKAMLKDPVLYRGQAYQRTVATCDYWEQEVELEREYLEAEETVLDTVVEKGLAAFAAQIEDAEADKTDAWREVTTQSRPDFIRSLAQTE